MVILPSSIAGTWYPGSVKGIDAAVAAFEERAGSLAAPSDTGKARAALNNIVILPHAGWAYSGPTAWCALRTLKGETFDRVVLLAPSHYVAIEDRLVAPEAAAVSTPLGEIAVDQDFIDRLSHRAPVLKNDRVHAREHSTQIEYPLLQKALGGTFKVAPFIIGDLGPEQMAMAARALAAEMDTKTLLVISSDFTHYGADFDYTPYTNDVRRQVAAVDAAAFDRIAALDADGFRAYVAKTGATICGRVPIELMLRAVPQGTKIVKVHYETSGDAEQDYERFVCYTAAAGHADWPGEAACPFSAADKKHLLAIARASIAKVLKDGKPFPDDHFAKDASAAIRKPFGAFVTLNTKSDGELRGCIGEIVAQRPLVEAVTRLAVESAFEDPRFPPLAKSELDKVRIEISALTPSKPVKGYEEIVLGRDGMTLEKDGSFAVFLPQVAPEQGWDLATTLSYLSRKAGLPADAWREGAKFTTFQAYIWHE